MIGRKNRFHGYNSLNNAYRHGKTVRGELISLKFVENPKRREYRAAVVVSKKVSKSAVVRNRIRRRVYELLRAESASITKPYDIVFTVFSDQVATIPAQKLEKMVKEQLAQAKITEHAIIGQKEN